MRVSTSRLSPLPERGHRRCAGGSPAATRELLRLADALMYEQKRNKQAHSTVKASLETLDARLSHPSRDSIYTILGEGLAFFADIPWRGASGLLNKRHTDE